MRGVVTRRLWRPDLRSAPPPAPRRGQSLQSQRWRSTRTSRRVRGFSAIGAEQPKANLEPEQLNAANAPILGGRYIEERNQSRYASGEIHDLIAFWSFDRGHNRFVFRQFHQEGFVNQFVASTSEFVVGRLVVESEAIENVPGFSFAGTYVFGGGDAFEEVFELAEPNGDFELY